MIPVGEKPGTFNGLALRLDEGRFEGGAVAVPSKEEFVSFRDALRDFRDNFDADVDCDDSVVDAVLSGGCDDAHEVVTQHVSKNMRARGAAKRRILEQEAVYQWLIAQHPARKIFGERLNNIEWWAVPQRPIAGLADDVAGIVQRDSRQLFGANEFQALRELMDLREKASRKFETDLTLEHESVLRSALKDEIARVLRVDVCMPINVLALSLYRYYYVPPQEAARRYKELAEQMRAVGAALCEIADEVADIPISHYTLDHYENAAMRLVRRNDDLAPRIEALSNPIGAQRRGGRYDERVLVAEVWRMSAPDDLLRSPVNLRWVLEFEGIRKSADDVRQVRGWIDDYRSALSERKVPRLPLDRLTR